MAHDQVWKEVLWSFFREFMELFFPDVAQRLDFGRLRLLEKELFTDIPEGVRREPDLLVEAHTHEGDIEIILVHIEVQARREQDVPYRMWEYYSLLRLRRKRPVFPLVVYLTPGTGGLTEERYTETLFGRAILSFRYAAVGLPDLPAEEYLEQANVLAPALSALMRAQGSDRVTRKLRAYERMARAPLDDARRSLLVNVIDRYLALNRAEQAELLRRIEQSEPKEVKVLITQWEERGIKKGMEQGKRETLLRQMRHKFGEIPDRVVARIDSIRKESELDALADRVLDAQSLEEMGLS